MGGWFFGVAGQPNGSSSRAKKDEMRQRILDEMELFERFLGCTLWKGNWLHPITLVIHLIVVGELVRLCSHGNPL